MKNQLSKTIHLNTSNIQFFQTWDLDSLYPGGSQSPALHAAIQRLKHDLQKFQRQFDQLSDLKKGILHFQELEGNCRDLQEFVHCLISQNVEDQEALKLHSQMAYLFADCESLGEDINALLAELDEETFKNLLSDPEIEPISFHLQERRQFTKEKLPVKQEQLAHQLAIDGYHGWNTLYGNLMGEIRIASPFNSEGNLSIGQAENRLSHPERNVRKNWFNRLEECWTSHENLGAHL